MKVYISGPMTGMTADNKPAFFAAEKALTARGFTVLNPACLPSSEEISYDEYMMIDLVMLSICDAIYMLNGWEDSKGANIELMSAIDNGCILMCEAGTPNNLKGK